MYGFVYLPALLYPSLFVLFFGMPSLHLLSVFYDLPTSLPLNLQACCLACAVICKRTKMGLPPLEYIDCFLDSPNFREVITLYEKELDSSAVCVESLVKECQQMIQATKGW